MTAPQPPADEPTSEAPDPAEPTPYQKALDAVYTAIVDQCRQIAPNGAMLSGLADLVRALHPDVLEHQIDNAMTELIRGLTGRIS